MLVNCVPFLLCLLGLTDGFSLGEEKAVVEVAAGEHDRVDSLLSVRLPEFFKGDGYFTLTRAESGDQIPVQLSRGTDPHLVWKLQDPLSAGTRRRYHLVHNGGQVKRREGVNVETDKLRVRVTVQGRPVLIYNTAVIQAANRSESYYDRSGYIHPLYNPNGQAITDDFAPDHPHQHGIMFPWTTTSFEGKAINFWDQQKGRGRIEHATVDLTESGDVFGGFVVRLKHLDITNTESPKTVLDETWKVRVYNFVDYFLFDLESVQRSLGSPLHVLKYHYGGFAIRGHRDWLIPGRGDFLTSEMKSRTNGNQSRPRWCDMFGTLNGEVTGVTIFCDPRNFRAPQPVRLHPEKPYFCFAPLALGAFKIESGTPYVSRYRLYVHTGAVEPAMAERLWHDLADPPKIVVTSSERCEVINANP